LSSFFNFFKKIFGAKGKFPGPSGWEGSVIRPKAHYRPLLVDRPELGWGARQFTTLSPIFLPLATVQTLGGIVMLIDQDIAENHKIPRMIE
jgi:hypothetical protein